MLRLVNSINYYRNHIWTVVVVKKYLVLKFKIITYWGLLRGFYSCMLGRVLYESSYRPLIVGPNVDFDMWSGASIVLTNNSDNSEIVDPANYLFPKATNLGVYPQYDHMNISMGHPTRMRLKNNAKLIFEQNTTVLIGCYFAVANDVQLRIGAESYIAHGVVINTRCGLTIGRNVMIGHETTIMDYDGHPIYVVGNEYVNCESYGGTASRIIIEDDVWIGFKSTILKGVKIGTGAIVGANSCVTSDVPPYSIVAGNPARIIKEGVRWERY